MAEGLLRHDRGDTFDVESAGTRATIVRPEAITVMQEIGIDISNHRSKCVEELTDGPSTTYSPCATTETCPVYPGHGQRFQQNFEDPAATTGTEEERLDAFRRVRDQLRTYLANFPPRWKDDSKVRIAFHEAGHDVQGYLCGLPLCGIVMVS